MDLLNGKFMDNGGCGYILKPQFLRNSETQFTPYNTVGNHQPIRLAIKVSSFC